MVGTPLIIVLIPWSDDKAYIENPAAILAAFVLCTVCPESTVLARNGSYPRYIPVALQIELGRIFRRKCRRCKTSFSLLPSFMVPFMQYPRSLVVWWLWAYLWGISSRNLRFLKKRALECPPAWPDTSWSDQLEEQPSRPSHRLLCRWSRRFSALAAVAIPALLHGFILQGCDLRIDLAKWLRPMHFVPARAGGLAIALGLWRALAASWSTSPNSVSLKKSLSSLVDYLLLPSSHSLVQVHHSVPGYDNSSTAGRSPPQTAAV